MAKITHFLPTRDTPEFILKPAEGLIIIRGRGMSLNRLKFKEKIKSCIDTYLRNPVETTLVKVEMEYLDSYNTSLIAAMIKNLQQLSLRNKKLVVEWYYEPDDDDILERGEFISLTFNIPINFVAIR